MVHGRIPALTVCSDELHNEIRGGLSPSLADLYQELDALVSGLPEDRRGALVDYVESAAGEES